LIGVRFSPDGRRLIAGDYPGGIVLIWDVETGKQLTKIETGHGLRGSSDYFFLTPDWSTMLVPQEKRKFNRFERDGKKLIRWEMDGGIRSWDLATGQLKDSYRHEPPRSIRHMWLSPDGRKFATYEELSGEGEGPPKRGTTLWDAATKQYRPMPDGFYLAFDGFSPDSQWIVGSHPDENGMTSAILVVDAMTTEVKRSIPIDQPNTNAVPHGFSPDGKLVIGQLYTYPGKRDYSSFQVTVKAWDASTGKELLSFAADEPKTGFSGPQFSPDGRLLAAATWRSSNARLLLFEMPESRLSKTIVLGDKTAARDPVFSPDGRWIAVMTQPIPENNRDPTPDQVPQARIHLIDVAAGEVGETMIAPPGFILSLCFSPDGKTLATGGSGKVHLWNLAGLK
jgi:WD40 repeat protein